MPSTSSHNNASPMVFFTICAKNFLAQAHTLYESLRRVHGPVPFYVALCDSPDGLELLASPFPIIAVNELGIPDWEWMRHNYNITELNTAVKPFAFLFLFDLHPGSPVVYLDPDIYVASRLSEVEEEFARGAECILTPHITEPAEFAEFHDQRFLQFGVYNLGFCAVRDSPQVRRVVSWWGRRLQRECVIDLPNGLFVDQKWADLLPAYIERTAILRHCGYNVAYWNLSQRRVWRDGARWMVNDRELRFAHFSGHVMRSPDVFSRHVGAFTRKNVGALSDVLDRYEQRLVANGQPHYSKLPYAFRWNGAKGVNLHTPERAAARNAVRLADPNDGVPHVPVVRETTFDGYHRTRAAQRAIVEARRGAELALLRGGEEAFWIRGHCVLCNGETEFQVGFMFASKRTADGILIPNWREHLNCKQCGLVNRVRAALHLFQQELRPHRLADVYITEAVTPAFRWLKEHFPHAVGSEYFAGTLRSGTVVNGIRHEDLQALSFADDSFDYILSFDVLEHVPDDGRAFREMFRCLRPGGAMLFIAPFDSELEENFVRAVLREDGSIQHLAEPEYHGNPVDPEGGALAYRVFGWDCLRQLSGLGFETPMAFNYWSRELGYLGDPQFAFIARKPLRT